VITSLRFIVLLHEDPGLSLTVIVKHSVHL
jgi:hypothetical protein